MDIRAAMSRKPTFLDFWSLPQEEVSIPAVAADQALPSITISGIPSNVVINRVVAMFKYRAMENTNAAANKLSGAQEIQVQKGAGAWADAINFVADMFGVDATTREGGDVFIGAIDLSGTVTADDTYNFQWDEALADLDSINFNDVQTGLRIYLRRT